MACSSPAQRAADAQAQAQSLTESGLYAAAAERFDYAVKMRDDLPDLWIMRARNQVKMRDFLGAFASYQSALDLDKTNREALDAVAQLSVATNDMDRAQKYAEQILILDPNDDSALLVKATALFRRGQLNSSQDIVNRVLSDAPDNQTALTLKSRILMWRGDVAGALGAILPIFNRGTGSFDLLQQLATLYGRLSDGRGLLSVAERIAHEQPKDAPFQLAFAKQLFLAGRTAEAASLLNAVHRAAPSNNLRVQTVSMFGDAALSTGQIMRGVATLSAPDPSLAAAVVQYGLERSEFAVTAPLVHILMARPLTSETAPFYGLYAQVLAQTNHRSDALNLAAATLSIDKGEPSALWAQAIVNLSRHNFPAALRDAQRVISENPSHAYAAKTAAQIFEMANDNLMGDKTLADGFNANKNDAQFFTAQTQQILKRGRTEDALDTARSFTIRNNASVTGWMTRQAVCRAAGKTDCVSRSVAILARLHGRNTPLLSAPPEEVIAQRDYRAEATQ
jgi:tetratricopeptide (TPR) repeat protein